MDTNSFKKKTDKKDDSVNESNESKKYEDLDKKILSKDEEIKALKAKLSEAQKVSKVKKGDIRGEVNVLGDVKRICVGLDDFGRRLFKKATELTESDIKRRDDYIESIKQQNAKKY